MIEIDDAIRAEALAHAQQDDPREACGLLLVAKGKQIYRPCRNISEDPNEMFTIDPDDYRKAEDDGEVLAVVHSHPITPPGPPEGVQKYPERQLGRQGRGQFHGQRPGGEGPCPDHRPARGAFDPAPE